MNFNLEPVQLIYDVVYYVVFNLTKAILAVTQPASYIYWPFLLSAVVAAFLVSRIKPKIPETGEGSSGQQRFRDLFRADIWWHRSSRADYLYYFGNALVLPLVFGALLFSDAQIVTLINNAIGNSSPATGQGAQTAGVWVRVLFTIAFFVAFDFGRFVAHCLLHDIPVLWEFHKVHHSAEVLTPATTYRVHPVDLLVMGWVPAVTTGIVAWCFNAFTGLSVTVYSYLGLHVVFWAFNIIDNLKHSPVWMSFGPIWGKWLISPAHHQLHHSYEPRHLGCNRGSYLAIWDSLYGTLYVPGAQIEAFRMGLGDGTDGRWHGLWRMYLWPFAGSVREALKLARRLTMRQELK